MPSPSRSHSYLVIGPSGSLDAEPLKVTVWPVWAGFGLTVNDAVGGCGPDGGSSVTSTGVTGWTPMSEKML